MTDLRRIATALERIADELAKIGAGSVPIAWSPAQEGPPWHDRHTDTGGVEMDQEQAVAATLKWLIEDDHINPNFAPDDLRPHMESSLEALQAAGWIDMWREVPCLSWWGEIDCDDYGDFMHESIEVEIAEDGSWWADGKAVTDEQRELVSFRIKTKKPLDDKRAEYRQQPDIAIQRAVKWTGLRSTIADAAAEAIATHGVWSSVLLTPGGVTLRVTIACEGEPTP